MSEQFHRSKLGQRVGWVDDDLVLLNRADANKNKSNNTGNKDCTHISDCYIKVFENLNKGLSARSRRSHFGGGRVLTEFRAKLPGPAYYSKFDVKKVSPLSFKNSS